MRMHKYHGLGNDYLVLDPSESPEQPSVEAIQLICHRNYGPGSDGILWGPLPGGAADFGLRIFNPDGSEAEKSGNGLRIFARYLFDQKLVTTAPFTVATAGGTVRCQVFEQGQTIEVEMGKVSFDSTRIPVAGPPREVVSEQLEVGGRTFSYCAATVGNPHCVLPLESISEQEARVFGPLLEVEPRFPNRTNVQFMKVLGRNDIQIEIWERGAGYTLASGSSSSAAAAVARRLGQCDRDITVHMPGGQLKITVEDDYSIRMTGPVTRIGECVVVPEAFTAQIPRS